MSSDSEIAETFRALKDVRKLIKWSKENEPD